MRYTLTVGSWNILIGMIREVERDIEIPDVFSHVPTLWSPGEEGVPTGFRASGYAIQEQGQPACAWQV